MVIRKLDCNRVDTTQTNILVNDSGQARITDFGLATIPQYPASKRALFGDETVRWTAPEILGNSGICSKEADVFSFAMVMIEVRYGPTALVHQALIYRRFASAQVLTGAVPFNASLPSRVMVAIVQGHRPPRQSRMTCSRKLWTLVERCWDQDPLLRPEMSEVARILPNSALDKLRCLYKPGGASPEFQLALDRFYSSALYQDHIDSLHGTDLEEFVDFLDTVRRPPNCAHPSACLDLQFRYYGLRD